MNSIRFVLIRISRKKGGINLVEIHWNDLIMTESDCCLVQIEEYSKYKATNLQKTFRFYSIKFTATMNNSLCSETFPGDLHATFQR